jgi:hypothetical protein
MKTLKDQLIGKLEELIAEFDRPPLFRNVDKMAILRSEIAKLREQVEQEENKPKRKSRYIPKVKICAGCGSFAHGNPGHDITY